VAVTQARHIPPEKISSKSGRGADPVIPPQRESTADEQQVLSTLRELVAAGEHRLDPMLAAIADAALLLTGASGVAIAMWKDGAMVCRARSGDTAPPLGAQLSADTGISGECLRTGKMQHCVDTEKSKLVDFEVCRTLRLRSIAVLPIQAGRGAAGVGLIRANGILEAFSTEQGAFNGHHLAVLEQLAGLAERARAAKPVGASPVVTPMAVVAPVEKPGPVGLLPASDRFVDFARAVVGRRPIVLGAVGLATILLLGLVIWLGWRGNDGNESKAHAATISTVSATVRGSGTDARPSNQPVAGQRVPDNDAVWKPNPGGQSLLVSSGKPSAARTVQAAGLDAADSKKHTNKSSDQSAGATVPGSPDASRVQMPPVSGSSSASGSPVAGAKGKVGDTSSLTSNLATSTLATSNPVELAAVGALPPGIGQSSQALNGVLSSRAALPTLSAQRVSQGVSGGQLIRRVPPIYPPQAKTLRIEGKVVIDAVVTEDGSVRDLRVVQGQPVFVGAAVDAVKQWRYKPFVLDGKVVSRPMRISVDFKLPSGLSAAGH
jgi:TonB family protein